MKFAFILGTLLSSQPVLAALVMNVQGTVTAHYEIDKNNIAEEVQRTFEGTSAVDAKLFGEKIKRSEIIEKDLKPTTQFLAPKKTEEEFEIGAARKIFANAAKEVLAPYVAMNRKEGMYSKVEYRLAHSNCQRFAQSIVCDTRLWARLRGQY